MRVMALVGSLMVFASVAPAQTVRLSYLVDDKQVTLSWNEAPGDTLTGNEIAVIQDPLGDGFTSRGFARYQIWKSLSPDPKSFELVRSYMIADSTWSFPDSIWSQSESAMIANHERVFADPDSIIIRGPEKDEDFDEEKYRIPGLHNGFDYYYAVTWDEAITDTDFGFNFHIFDQMQSIEEGMIGPIQPQRPSHVGSPLLEEVEVVPNPYNPKHQGGHFPDSPRIQFVGLPQTCTISIYSAAGDLVRQVEHNSMIDAENWDLTNDNDQDVASGIYFYRIDSANQFLRGRFVVIR